MDVAVSTGTQTVTPKYACLMTDEVDNPAVCNYALVAGTFSLLASLAVSILQVRGEESGRQPQRSAPPAAAPAAPTNSRPCSPAQCVTCKLCGCGRLDFIFGVAGAAWWLLAALVFK